MCKPLGYQQENLQRHLQFTRAFTKRIYKNKMQCKIRLQVKMSKLSLRKK
jgi:hypothetical protein